jgi:hypothetical protein
LRAKLKSKTRSDVTARGGSPVRMGIVSRSTLALPFFVARERGFFREEGLEPELVLMRASLTAKATVIAGSARTDNTNGKRKADRPVLLIGLSIGRHPL